MSEKVRLQEQIKTTQKDWKGDILLICIYQIWQNDDSH